MESIARAKDERRKRRLQGNWLLGIGLGLTVIVAGLGVWWPGFDVVSAVALTALAGLFQVLGGIAAGSSGPTEQTVRIQLANELLLFEQLDALRIKAENAYETGNADARRRALGEISAVLTCLQGQVSLSFYAWESIHPDLLDGGGPRTEQLNPPRVGEENNGDVGQN